MIAEQVPGQLADLAMVLVRVVLPMGQHDVGRDAGAHAIEPGLDRLALIGEEAVLEARELDPAARGAGEERARRALGLGGARPGRAQHAPVDLEPHPRGEPAEEGAAGADLDVVRMRAKTQDRERGARPGQLERDHRPASDRVRPRLPAASPTRHGILPVSTICSSTWRSFRLSMARQKPSCL